MTNAAPYARTGTKSAIWNLYNEMEVLYGNTWTRARYVTEAVSKGFSTGTASTVYSEWNRMRNGGAAPKASAKKESNAGMDALRAELAEAKASEQRARDHIKEQDVEIMQLKGNVKYLKNKQVRGTNAGNISKADIRRLKQFCHPDRHAANEETATAILQMLNAL